MEIGLRSLPAASRVFRIPVFDFRDNVPLQCGTRYQVGFLWGRAGNNISRAVALGAAEKIWRWVWEGLRLEVYMGPLPKRLDIQYLYLCYQNPPKSNTISPRRFKSFRPENLTPFLPKQPTLAHSATSRARAACRFFSGNCSPQCGSLIAGYSIRT